ncbi:MAG: hypothetical protein ACYC9O_06390 [Candidatus Latescibacterota bacterium]
MPIYLPTDKLDRSTLLHPLYGVLETALGPLHWWPAETPFEVCTGAILTQNAPWTGVAPSVNVGDFADKSRIVHSARR